MKKAEFIFKIIISLSLMTIVIILAYTLIFNKKSSLTKNESKIYEDSIKNKSELFLIESKLISYIKQLNEKNFNLDNFYNSNIDYYDKALITRDSVIKDKKVFFKKWDNIKIEITNLQIIKDSNGYNCTFDKSFNLTAKDNSFYKGKVKSNIKFVNYENDWIIIREKDDEIYYTEKSKSLKEFIEEFRKEVPKNKDYFLEHVDSPLIITYTEITEKVSAISEYESIKRVIKSNFNLKNNTVTFNEFTYEYSQDGSIMPHEFFFKKDNNSKWILYKIKWAGC